MEPQQITFTLQDIVKMILRAQGIREGHWELTVETRVTPMGAAVGDEGPLPSVIVQFAKCGIVRTPEPTACSVDAALLEWPETIPA